MGNRGGSSGTNRGVIGDVRGETGCTPASRIELVRSCNRVVEVEVPEGNLRVLGHEGSGDSCPDSSARTGDHNNSVSQSIAQNLPFDYHVGLALMPPSTMRSVPVIHVAIDDARKTHALPMS